MMISCIMPTYNRRAFVPQAIRYFLRQDHPDKELIIIDDGEDAIADLVPVDERIRYYRLERKITLGAKLNLCCEYARGPLIAHWDDDDWYASWRLRYQAEAMIAGGASLCGINRLLYYDQPNRRGFEYIYPAGQRVWLIGSSLFYRKELWATRRFADINVGMDGLFVWAAPEEQVLVLPEHEYCVHLIHGQNVSPKKTEGRWWHAFPVERLRAVVGEDWVYYEGGQPAWDGAASPRPVKAAPRWRNIFACLVHEREDCVIDLVRNLHQHDPGSTILLYNGGSDPSLLTGDFPYEEYGARIVPGATPMKWGYLHQFGLDCMAYAGGHLQFDSLTIVDSDQLCLRNGYSAYLGRFLGQSPETGMLSSMPQRVTKDQTKMSVAMHAYREYQLWKPLLDSFPGGEEKFIHWTYWPSTVFTAAACRDLVKLFRENTLLQEIMQKTAIWATEEVILPLMVRLLGYTIAANPCGYDIVRFRKFITAEELRSAFTQEHIYWAHPVRRVYDDAIRTFIRQRAIPQPARPQPAAPAHFPLASLLPRIRKIGGWLSDAEADLLGGITLKACEPRDCGHHIVEIGSYHGKSTVLFATLIKSCGLKGTVHAIDIHDGRLGAADQGLRSYPPSFGIFNHNISQAGVRDVVVVIKERSYNVEWSLRVSLLFIDGLHDYTNVRRDFDHFAGWLVPGGFVAFHDYADYYPGVKTCVDELLATGEFAIAGQKESLMVLQKNAQ